MPSSNMQRLLEDRRNPTRQSDGRRQLIPLVPREHLGEAGVEYNARLWDEHVMEAENA